MSKWKCEICGVKFENFHAQGFNNKIYCPLCYFKRENQELKKQLEEINNFINKADFANIEQLMLDYCAKLEEQKEFMEYLEDKLAIINNILDTEKDEDKVYFTLIRKDVVEETLLKYKEIIGGKYEGNKNL